MPYMDSIVDLISEISDDELQDVADAVRTEQEDRARELFRSLNTGDTVRIKPGFLDKKYLAGAEAEVIETRVSKVTIQFPASMEEHDPYNKYAGTSVIVPPICLEKVN